MEREQFNRQIDRLKSQWPNAYGPERLLRIWTIYRGVSNEIFGDMVDLALDRMRGAPLAEDFATLEAECANLRARQRTTESFRGLPGILEDAARENKQADPDFVKACMKLLKDKLDGKITESQFREGCDALDELADQLNPSGRSRHVGTTNR